MSFAERYGFRPTRVEVQVDDLDGETRTALWNVFQARLGRVPGDALKKMATCIPPCATGG